MELFLLGLVIGIVVGAAVMFLVYRNNTKKLNNIATIVQSGKMDSETAKKLLDVLK
jgi:gas vesicle protein